MCIMCQCYESHLATYQVVATIQVDVLFCIKCMSRVVYSLFCFLADSTVYNECLAFDHLLCEHFRSVVIIVAFIQARAPSHRGLEDSCLQI